MRIKAKYHYGDARSEQSLTFSEFLQVMQDSLDAMPGNAGREQFVFDCLHGLLIDGRGEFGWTTYTLEGK